MSENSMHEEIDTLLAIPKEALAAHIEMAIAQEPSRKYLLLMQYSQCLLRHQMNIDGLPTIYAQVAEECDDEKLVGLAYWIWGVHLIEVKSDLDGGIEKIDKARSISDVFNQSIISIISKNLKDKDYQTAALWSYCLAKDPKYTAAAHQILGKIFMLLKEYESAIGALEESLDADENNPDTLLMLIEAYLQINEEEASMEYQLQYLQVVPDDVEVLINTAIHYHKKEDFYRAMAYYTRALKIEPNNTYVYLNIAKLYVTIEEDYKTAIEYLNKLVELIETKKVGIKTQINTYGLLCYCHQQLTQFEEMEEYAVKFGQLSKLDNKDSTSDFNNPNTQPGNDAEEEEEEE